jgi:hypothetical protein
MPNNAIMDALMGEYEAKRAKNAREEARRFSHAVSLCPEIGKVADTRREAPFSAMRLTLSPNRGKEAIPIWPRIWKHTTAALGSC